MAQVAWPRTGDSGGGQVCWTGGSQHPVAAPSFMLQPSPPCFVPQEDDLYRSIRTMAWINGCKVAYSWSRDRISLIPSPHPILVTTPCFQRLLLFWPSISFASFWSLYKWWLTAFALFSMAFYLFTLYVIFKELYLGCYVYLDLWPKLLFSILLIICSFIYVYFHKYIGSCIFVSKI